VLEHIVRTNTNITLLEPIQTSFQMRIIYISIQFH